MDAIQGFFYGYYDGITGLVKEPMQGAKKGVRYIFPISPVFTDAISQGFMGAIKGSARSCE